MLLIPVFFIKFIVKYVSCVVRSINLGCRYSSLFFKLRDTPAARFLQVYYPLNVLGVISPMDAAKSIFCSTRQRVIDDPRTYRLPGTFAPHGLPRLRTVNCLDWTLPPTLRGNAWTRNKVLTTSTPTHRSAVTIFGGGLVLASVSVWTLYYMQATHAPSFSRV